MDEEKKYLLAVIQLNSPMKASIIAKQLKHTSSRPIKIRRHEFRLLLILHLRIYFYLQEE